MKKHILLTLSILILAAALLAAPLQNALAADAVVGDGSPASCTEAALDSALTTVGSGGGIITFDCGPAIHTIDLTNTKFLNLGDVTINGNGLIILNANNVDRHFFVGNGVTFRLQNITLRDGNSAVGGGAIEASGAHIILESVQLLNNYAPNQGGAVYCYIGIGGTLTVNNSLFENNTSTNGGAIYNDGCTTTIRNTTFRTNQATGAGGAIHNAFAAPLQVNGSLFQANTALDGGGLFNDSGAAVTLHSVTFQSNTAGHGGGVENSGALTMTHGLLDGNLVTGSGGGLWNLGGTVILRQTTVSNNSAYEGGGVNSYGSALEMQDVNIVGNVATGSHGGGLYHVGGTAFITNATISGNMASASAANGGGIYQSSDDNMTLTNVTLANNQAGLFGGGFYHYGRYAVLTNVTLANNLAGAAGDAIYEDSPQTPSNPGIIQMVNSVIFGSAVNCDGTLFQSVGHNLSQGTCTSLSDPTDQDNYASDLLLGSLAFNGGAFAMQTILPQAGSPLIDAGDTLNCPAIDQRSATRIGVCDLGAAEYGAIAYKLYLPLVVR
jgi:predicted outer membrane repeat protein